MSSDLKFRVTVVVLLALVGVYVAVPTADKPGFRDGGWFAGKVIRLGLDLQGGAEMTVVVDPTGEDRKPRIDPATGREIAPARRIADLTEQARSVLERRINIRGLKEPVIRRQGADKILIQLPGIDEAEVARVKELLQKSGRLDLRLVAKQTIIDEYGGPPTPPPAGFEWLENIDPKTKANRPYWLCDRTPVVTGEDLESAVPEVDVEEVTDRPRGGPAHLIRFRLKTMGAKRFEEFTGAHVGERLAIVLDGRVKSAPTIQSRISDEGRITGDFTEQEARDLATTLRSGSLPCRVAIEGQGAISYVGPVLGEDSIRSGAIACLLSFALVSLFMVVYYRGCGVAAVLALFLNLVFILALMAVFEATLTLPGIAGLLLTIGMAVDGNILVFERIREEKEKGKTPAQAFEAGHERAFVTIVDSNLTTLAAGIILYLFGTGPIQGFAVTTSVGILTTLFTVLFCSRTILRWAMALGILRDFSMMRLFAKPSISFTRYFRVCGVLSLAAIAAGAAAMWARGDEGLGIDFRGGTLVQPRFTREITPAELRAKLGALQVSDADGKPVPKYPGLDIQTVIPPEEGKSLRQGVWNPFKNVLRTGSLELQIKTGSAYPGLGTEQIDLTAEQVVNSSGQTESVANPFHRGIRLTFVPHRPTTPAEVEKALAGAIAPLEGEPKPRVELLPSAGGLPRGVAVQFTPRQAESRAATEAALRRDIGIVNSLRDDIVEFFGDSLSKFPFENERAATDNPRDPYYGGKALTVNLQAPVDAGAVEGVLREVFKDASTPQDVYRVEAAGVEAGKPSPAMNVTLSAAAWGRFDEVKTALKAAGSLALSKEPFQKETTVGAAVARDLKENAVIAAVLSWGVMILYLAVRFRSWMYGLAAVVALVHDVLISVGAVALCGLLVPKSWGLNFEFSLQTVAAALTIIGFSVNDTIVIFDRIRENLTLLRREPLRNLIDLSVNQTISRTILTSLTVFLVVTLLYGVTMRSAGGIAEFAFPMILGVVAGTYSTVYIAAPFLLIGRGAGAAARPQAPVAVS